MAVLPLYSNSDIEPLRLQRASYRCLNLIIKACALPTQYSDINSVVFGRQAVGRPRTHHWWTEISDQLSSARRIPAGKNNFVLHK